MRVKVTKKIIESSNVWDIQNCIGANTLKKAYPKAEQYTWGSTQGGFTSKDGVKYFKSVDKQGERVKMTWIEEPCYIYLEEIEEWEYFKH